MIVTEKSHLGNKIIFNVSPKLIWCSALFMGVLASVPKILQLHITLVELSVDSSVAFLFSLSVWYYNIYSLPKFSSKHRNGQFFTWRLIYSLLIGVFVMLILVGAHQWMFPSYHFLSMIMMFEFRGILINLTIYMFLYLLFQSYLTQLISVELERVQADHLGAQYELLKQQINPHFLFNSLSTLKAMIEIDDEHAVEFILKLSDFYRFTLENRKRDIIPLMEELSILNAYIFLLQARFEEGISLVNTIGPDHSLTYIPPFTLQLLVENCIKHNVVSVERPLRIKLYIQDNHLIVENSVQLKKIPGASTAMGLENINQRYQHLIQQQIEIEKGAEKFKVILPLIYENSHC